MHYPKLKPMEKDTQSSPPAKKPHKMAKVDGTLQYDSYAFYLHTDLQ
jgi:hypothetical protein